MNMLELRELVQFLKESGIAEFELDREDQHVRLKFESAFVQPAAAPALTYAMPAPAHLPGVAAAVSATSHADPAGSSPAANTPRCRRHGACRQIADRRNLLREFRRPAPQPFIKVGDTVEVGQVLCIVEAMKLMNEIESDVAGEVVRIIAKNGSAVEYGQPLFAVKAR